MDILQENLALKASLLEMKETDEALEKETNVREPIAESPNFENILDDVERNTVIGTLTSESLSKEKAGTDSFLEKNSDLLKVYFASP